MPNNDQFLPTGTEIPKSPSNYMKLSEPQNRFRILGSAIVGYELWISGKPVRKKERKFTVEEYDGADINKFTGEKKKDQYFWAFPVYNYQTEKIEILEITQRGVMKGIEDFLKDEDYGSDPKKYDLVVIREEEDIVKYRVIAKPPKDIDEGITQLFNDMKINLEALYEGGDPFASGADTGKIAEEVFEGLKDKK